MSIAWALVLTTMLSVPASIPTADAAQQREPAILLAQARQPVRSLALGETTIRDRRIENRGVALLQVLLADGTTITLADNSAMTIRSFDYDRGAGRASIVVTLSQGRFRYVGGRTNKTPDGVRLETRHGALAVDRGMVDIDLGGGSEPHHFDMVFGKEMVLRARARTLARVYESGYSIVVEGGSAKVRKTPAEWRHFTLD